MLTPEQAREASRKIEEAEARAEARTEAMLDRLIEKRNNQKKMDVLWDSSGNRIAKNE